MQFLKRANLDVPLKKTASNQFFKDTQEKKKELNGAAVSQANTITSRQQKKVKTNNKDRKNYIYFHEIEKQRYEKDLLHYQEDKPEEEVVISLHKRCNKTGSKTDPKASVNVPR